LTTALAARGNTIAEFERLDGDLKQLGLNLLKAEVWYMRRSVHW